MNNNNDELIFDQEYKTFVILDENGFKIEHIHNSEKEKIDIYSKKYVNAIRTFINDNKKCKN